MSFIDEVVLISSVSTEMIFSTIVGMSGFFLNICNGFFNVAFTIQPGSTDELQVCLLMYSVPIKKRLINKYIKKEK